MTATVSVPDDDGAGEKEKPGYVGTRSDEDGDGKVDAGKRGKKGVKVNWEWEGK